ncbi:MAG: sugar transferase [Candidatus Cloacimonetes bacterium]|nr:sugar transferase [Candidatus Cloacimonadota bacterium]
MKCLIYSPLSHSEWVQEFFPGINPYFLKYLNKPLLEYYIDFCVLLGISDVRVINHEAGSDLEEYFGNGTQWGINLSYSFAKPEDSLQQVLSKNRKFCDDGLLLIYGYQFIRYDINESNYQFLSETKAVSISGGNCFLYNLPQLEDIREIEFEKIADYQDSELEIEYIYSIRKYYELNMELISHFREKYVLPGYNNEDGAYLGKNIIDKKSTKYTKPIVLGNNVQIQMNTLIGPNVVLGNNVIIDHSTQIVDSIIYDRSYIGSELEIDKKIVYKKRLIDPISEEVMQIVDSFLVSDIQNNLVENSVLRVLYGFFTFFLILMSTVPYIFFFLVCYVLGMRLGTQRYFMDKNGKVGTFPAFKLQGYNFFKRFFFRFSLDLYPMYFKVLKGKISLVGNHPVTQGAEGVKLLMELPAYLPGIYNYPGSMLHNTSHENFINDELEYIHTRSFLFDMRVVLEYWISRLFSEWRSISIYLGEECEQD